MENSRNNSHWVNSCTVTASHRFCTLRNMTSNVLEQKVIENIFPRITKKQFLQIHALYLAAVLKQSGSTNSIEMVLELTPNPAERRNFRTE